MSHIKKYFGINEFLMKNYFIKYSGYFLILGLVIIGMRVLGIEHRRLESLAIWGQYITENLF